MIADGGGGAVEPSADVVLSVRGLKKAYGTASGDLVCPLDGLTFTIGARELVAVYGPSGSGKTTLLKLVARALEPDEGVILVRGRDVGELNASALDSYRLDDLGIVLQSGQQLIAGLSVVENAALRLMERGMRWRDAERQVVPLLERLDLGGQLERRLSEISVGPGPPPRARSPRASV
jgi:putative ABC transport system ATP-binding protein